MFITLEGIEGSGKTRCQSFSCMRQTGPSTSKQRSFLIYLPVKPLYVIDSLTPPPFTRGMAAPFLSLS